MHPRTLTLAAAALAAAVAAPASAAEPLSAPAAGHQTPPEPPNPLGATELNLVSQAGTGGPTAYARAGVVELGGGLALRGGGDFGGMTIKPQVGYFLTDNFELSTIFEWERRGGRNERVAFLVEPSAHLPILKTVFGFVGLGLGVGLQQDLVGLAVAPRIGANIVVGRSGILTPALGLMSTLQRTEAGERRNLLEASWVSALNIGYSVMW